LSFNPNAAAVAAALVDKVRINPGNFADGAKKFRDIQYSDATYQKEVDEIRATFLPFLNLCRQHGTSLRIGANHGSLSDRIMARYGDTPKGMVESCMEYLRICRGEGFTNVVLSIKSSNTRVMVHTVRLLNATMKAEGMNFPLHLGVTEAGSGEDGRIKSAVGIGALMADGLGDTIRVSLTEDPELEIPVAQLLKTHFEAFGGHAPIKPVPEQGYHPYEYVKRETHAVGIFGGGHLPAVVPDFRGMAVITAAPMIPDAVMLDHPGVQMPSAYSSAVKICPANSLTGSGQTGVLPLFRGNEKAHLTHKGPCVLQLSYPELDESLVQFLKVQSQVILLLTTSHRYGVGEQRAFFLALHQHGLTHPVIVHRIYTGDDKPAFQVDSGADTGLLFLDGYGDGLSLAGPNLSVADVVETHFGILQAARVRFSRTEFISCPGCGRTLFDLQTTTLLIRERTSHLKGLKIAIMGCIVNGIGEMADADYGYVGAGPGRVSLFKNRELVVKNLPEQEAVARLIELIQEGGHWVEP
jgi:(E)-4-hydroxy-3-methylbut-2-enyl-diphosphate synthase